MIFEVLCGGKRHKIGLFGGRLHFFNHTKEEIQRESNFATLGGTGCRCYDVLYSWQHNIAEKLPLKMRPYLEFVRTTGYRFWRKFMTKRKGKRFLKLPIYVESLKLSPTQMKSSAIFYRRLIKLLDKRRILITEIHTKSGTPLIDVVVKCKVGIDSGNPYVVVSSTLMRNELRSLAKTVRCVGKNCFPLGLLVAWIELIEATRLYVLNCERSATEQTNKHFDTIPVSSFAEENFLLEVDSFGDHDNFTDGFPPNFERCYCLKLEVCFKDPAHVKILAEAVKEISLKLAKRKAWNNSDEVTAAILGEED